MRKFLYITATFMICAFFGLIKIWVGFTFVYVLFTVGKRDTAPLWEIPMAVLACSIITDAFADYTAECIKIIIPVASVLTAYYFPAKLLLLFPVAIGSLITVNEFAVAAMWATLWCAGREFITERQKTLHYSNIKKKLLQGNPSENYIEFSGKCDILESDGSISP